MQPYLTLIRHSDDYTLLVPTGGEPTRGFDASPEVWEAMARRFRNGEADLEPVQSYASADLVVSS